MLLLTQGEQEPFKLCAASYSGDQEGEQRSIIHDAEYRNDYS